jgi:hypothetical protein
MANHEAKPYADAVDVLMAFSRTKDGQKAKCLRQVVRDFETDLYIMECRVKRLGGKWRIHKTVNKRDTKKAMKWLQHKLLDFPEGAGFIDSLWRTALLQPECVYGEKKFMLDVDTKDANKLEQLEKTILNLDSKGFNNAGVILEKIETENGWHYITKPFDTREVCKLDYVTLQRDGYVYIKSIHTDPLNK